MLHTEGCNLAAELPHPTVLILKHVCQLQDHLNAFKSQTFPICLCMLSSSKLFWTDWDQTYPRIEMCSMSGNRSTRQVLFNVSEVVGAGWPNGLTVDYQGRRIYWIDAKSDSIHTISYLAQAPDHREVLRGHEFLSHPFAISVFGNFVYWTDWRTNSLVKVSKCASDPTQSESAPAWAALKIVFSVHLTGRCQLLVVFQLPCCWCMSRM